MIVAAIVRGIHRTYPVSTYLLLLSAAGGYRLVYLVCADASENCNCRWPKSFCMSACTQPNPSGVAIE